MAMAAAFIGHEIAMIIARRIVVLLKVSDLNTPVLVVAVPGSRYFIIVVSFTHISGLIVSVSRFTCNLSNAEGHRG